MCFFITTLIFLSLPVVFIYLRQFLSKKSRRANNVISCGFFHPYCNAGGGGERVLWAAIRSVQNKYRNAHCVVYTGDPVSSEEILKNVEQRFNIKLPRKIEIIFLRSRFLVEARYYPFLTLLMQSLASIFLGLEAIVKHVPDVYIDTMGYAWTYPVFKYLGLCEVVAYVHYPVISTDMLKIVENRQYSFNNRKFISNSKFFSYLKFIYYKIFAYFYGVVGRQANVIMVNSSWTFGHIADIWQQPKRTFIVYPPCDVTEFSNIPLEAHDGKTKMLSIAQFRPEKNHSLQLAAFQAFLSRIKKSSECLPVLALVGSCRHEEDYQRVENLKAQCSQLEIEKNVEFKINLTFQEIIREMSDSSVALHTMTNEHFGIGVVECMAAGLIMIAHDSGGPKMDIVVDYNGERTGFLATDVDSFATAMESVWNTDVTDLREIRNNARLSMLRFSEQKFEETFLNAFQKIHI